MEGVGRVSFQKEPFDGNPKPAMFGLSQLSQKECPITGQKVKKLAMLPGCPHTFESAALARLMGQEVFCKADENRKLTVNSVIPFRIMSEEEVVNILHDKWGPFADKVCVGLALLLSKKQTDCNNLTFSSEEQERLKNFDVALGKISYTALQELLMRFMEGSISKGESEKDSGEEGASERLEEAITSLEAWIADHHDALKMEGRGMSSESISRLERLVASVRQTTFSNATKKLKIQLRKEHKKVKNLEQELKKAKENNTYLQEERSESQKKVEGLTQQLLDAGKVIEQDKLCLESSKNAAQSIEDLVKERDKLRSTLTALQADLVSKRLEQVVTGGVVGAAIIGCAAAAVTLLVVGTGGVGLIVVIGVTGAALGAGGGGWLGGTERLLGSKYKQLQDEVKKNEKELADKDEKVTQELLKLAAKSLPKGTGGNKIQSSQVLDIPLI